MILAIDAGNTRIKWGLWADRGYVAQGALRTERVHELPDALHMLSRPGQVIGSNVAGEVVARQVEQALAPWHLPVRWIRSAARQAGVESHYAEPTQLGTDRWAALIGAHQRFPEPCLVVDAGTAVTIDALTGTGAFLGGLILPGIDLIGRALATGTAGLAQASGRFEAFPTNTANAIYSGALQALLGAIERMRRALAEREGGEPRVVVTGGAGQVLAPMLQPAPTLVPTLVLDGLVVIAGA